MELETFKETVLPLKEKLFNISIKLIDEKEDAEDIVQETFLKLWSMREKLHHYQSVEALAVVMTKNLTFDKIKGKRPRADERELLLFDSGVKNPVELLEQKEAVARIGQLINKLPSLQQTIIRMKDIEGYELAEIAEITGSHVEAIRVNLSRARKKIREQFVEQNNARV